MATNGDTIAIIKVPPPLSVTGRYNTIKFTFTLAVGTTLHTVRMYDVDGIIISEMHNVKNNTEYCIVTGEEVDTDLFYAMPPAPVDSIDFLPGGEDNTTHGAVITNILVGNRVAFLLESQRYLVLQEVNDNRILGASGGYATPIQGGDPLEWPRDEVTYMYYQQYEPYIGDPLEPDLVNGNQFDYINRDEMFMSQALESNGELIPIIGNALDKIDIGMLTHPAYVAYSRGFR